MSKKVLSKLEASIRYPCRACRAIVQMVKDNLLWEYYYSSVREPKIRSSVVGLPDNTKTKVIVDQLKENRLCVNDFKIDVDEFRQYLEKAQYNRFPKYYGGGKGRNFIEKSLEHYLAAKVLEISRNDVYIDIASSNSPAAEIYHKLYGCETYRQDLVFPRGLNGNVIGGNACNMPVTDEFATKMALHCSFEHFEQDSDIGFIKEASRVLRNGGELCIVPLYLHDGYIIATNPAYLPKEDRTRESARFDADAILYCHKIRELRYNRFYDVNHLIARIIRNSNLKATIYVIQNEKEVDSTCYAKFIALFEKLD